LVAKWRGCAQKAAERVFVDARNRIDRLGGYSVFMEQQKQMTMKWDDDDVQQRGSQDESQRDERREDENGEDERGGKEEDEDAGDEFTMEIMLKMAGVEEKLIGWNQELNNFIKT
jgi:hypothetical protein